MNLPNKITVFRLILIPIFAVLFLTNFSAHYLYAAIIFIAASLTDFLDGYLARKLNLVTDVGKFLDPLADKTLVCTALILVCTFENRFKLLIIIATIIIVVRELAITCFRTIAASKNIVLAADFWGKIKTALQMFGLSFYIAYPSVANLNAVVGDLFMYAGTIAICLAMIFAIISAFNYLIKNRKVFSSKEDVSKICESILREIKGTVAVAESFTGGSICRSLVGVPGASKHLIKGIVCYSNESKVSDLGVPAQSIEQYGAVSREVAEHMARGIVNVSGCDYGVATTGNAGPTSEKEGEVGVCYIAVANKRECVVQKFEFCGNRETVISEGCKTALKMLLKTVKEN